MNKTNMEKVKYRYNRWRLALGRLVNLRYINRWIIFCADLFISLCVSLIGVLGLLSIMHVYISGISVLKVGIASFVASILSFLTFKVYHGVIRHSTLRGLWRIGGVAITKSILMFILLHLLRADFNSSIYWVGGITDCMLTIVLLITLRVFVINVYKLAVGVGRSHFEATSMMLQAQVDGRYDFQSEMEQEITRRVNEANIGPLGLHGKTSVIATFMKVGPQRASGVRIVCVRPTCCFEPRIASVELE